MKVLAKILIVVMMLFATSITCFADDGKTSNVGSTDFEVISLEHEAEITYQTTVVDLTTGTQYYAKTGKPAVIEAEIGHQYYVLANAQTTLADKDIAANAHFKVSDSSLTINYNFSEGGSTFNHTYSFAMPDGTHLTFVDDSLFSNCDQNSKLKWKTATGEEGITTQLNQNRAVIDGFILEVVEDTDPAAAFFAIFLILLLFVSFIIVATGIIFS